MILKQFYLGCLAHASYLVIDERSKSAVVVDPQRDVEQYVEEADRHGVTITHVVLTHFHADFVAGHLELRDRLGARICLGARAKPEYDFTPLRDGDVLQLGDVRLKVLETPGHTPEGISLVAYDLSEGGPTPIAVFTGDTLFVGDVGRPDLLASVGVSAECLAEMLYGSLHDKLLKLPDSTIVYPAHGAGSRCGKRIGEETSSTIGEQRRLNYALQPMSKEAFTALVAVDQPEAPPYFAHDAAMNRAERDTLDATMERALTPLSTEDVVRLVDAGALVVDVRPAADFAGAHLAGSLNVGLEGKFASWAGVALGPDAPIVIVAEPDSVREVAMRLGRVGLDRVEGYLEGGMAALEDRDDLVASIERITAPALASRLAKDDAPLLLDVRTESEWDEGHVEGSVHLPLLQLGRRLDEVPHDRDVVVACRTGYRSSLAASVLRRAGFERVIDLVGGMEAWRASDLPVARVEPTGVEA